MARQRPQFDRLSGKRFNQPCCLQLNGARLSTTLLIFDCSTFFRGEVFDLSVLCSVSVSLTSPSSSCLPLSNSWFVDNSRIGEEHPLGRKISLDFSLLRSRIRNTYGTDVLRSNVADQEFNHLRLGNSKNLGQPQSTMSSAPWSQLYSFYV